MKLNKQVITSFLITAAVLFIFLGCGPDKKDNGTTSTADNTGGSGSGGTVSFLNNKLYKLKLRLEDYLVLRNAPGPGANNAYMIVFQFVYQKTSTMPVTMVGYSARPNHQFNNGGVVLRYLEAFEEVNINIPGTAIFGDQQLRIGRGASEPGFDKFLRDAGIDPDHPTQAHIDSTELIFTPVLDNDGLHIRYNICLKNPNHCPQPAEPTQPSPPADANP